MQQLFTDKLLVSLTDLQRLIGSWLDDHLINIIAILIGAWIIRRFGAGAVSRVLRYTVRPDLYPTVIDRNKRVKTLNSLVTAVMRVGVYVIATILIIGEINPTYTTALFASAGLIGVALGFGAQSLIKDFISGMFIITENQYRVGDTVDIGGVQGIVEDVTIRTTVLRDLNGHVHHVPNGIIQVTTNKTIGFSGINEEIVVASATDIPQLEHVINHAGEQLAAIPELQAYITEAPAFSQVMGMTANGMVIKITGKTTPGDSWRVKSELYRILKRDFDKNKIKLGMPLVPFPTASKKK